MPIRLAIDDVTAPFHDAPRRELARVLRVLADELEAGEPAEWIPIYDRDGRLVGHVEMSGLPGE